MTRKPAIRWASRDARKLAADTSLKLRSRAWPLISRKCFLREAKIATTFWHINFPFPRPTSFARFGDYVTIVYLFSSALEEEDSNHHLPSGLRRSTESICFSLYIHSLSRKSFPFHFVNPQRTKFSQIFLVFPKISKKSWNRKLHSRSSHNSQLFQLTFIFLHFWF